MKKITRNNYELYAIDYIEATLSMEDREAFKLFLQINPDIVEELKSLPEFTYDPELSLSKEEHLDLKKGTLLSSPVSLDNYEYYFIAFHENDLSENEASEVKSFLKNHPDKLIDFEQLSVLKYHPDNSIIYADKNKLKQAVPMPISRLLLRVAAIFIFLSALAIYLFTAPNKALRYTERQSEIEMPLKTVEEDLIVQLNETPETSPVKKSVIQKDAEKESIKYKSETPIYIDNTEELAEVKVEEALVESPYSSEEIVDLPIEDEISITENTDTPEEVITSTEAFLVPANESDAIIKFKRPRFKKQKDGEELLASNDDVVLRVANPFKNSKKKGLKFGPIKIKRKKG